MDIRISKEELLSTCKEQVNERVAFLRMELKKVKESADAETKSSMGDKYETGREMMMQEEKKLQDRLGILLNQKTALESIDPKQHQNIKFGSLVVTNQSVFFIAVALGAFKFKDQQVFVVSQNAPLVKEMLGKEKGASVSFNGREQKILEVS